MIDVVTIKATDAARSGSVQSFHGAMGLYGLTGELQYEVVSPTKMVRWRAAELLGTFRDDSGSVKVRVTDGTSQFYFDETLMRFEPVTDEGSWLEQFMRPSLLANLDMWTLDSMGVVVRMTRTASDPNPLVKDLRVLMDFPTWAGAADEVVRAVATLLKDVQPVLIVTDVPAAPQRSWTIGGATSERLYDVSELVQVTVDGRHRSARLVGSEITVEGPEVAAGSVVEIAVKYRPPVAIKRGAEVRIIHRVPCWTLQDLIVAGGLNGIGTPIIIGGHTVASRRTELRLIVNGFADRTTDSFAMRQAIQEAFGAGITVVLPSRRELSGSLDGLVEVGTKSTTTNTLPMASGIVALSMVEYSTDRVFRQARTAPSEGLPNGSLVTTTVGLDIGPGEALIRVDENSELQLIFDE